MKYRENVCYICNIPDQQRSINLNEENIPQEEPSMNWHIPEDPTFKVHMRCLRDLIIKVTDLTHPVPTPFMNNDSPPWEEI